MKPTIFKNCCLVVIYLCLSSSEPSFAKNLPEYKIGKHKAFDSLSLKFKNDKNNLIESIKMKKVQILKKLSKFIACLGIQFIFQLFI